MLKGLSQPLPALSLEYLAAASDIALEAIARLAALGRYRFNLSAGETMRLALPEWCSAAEMSRHLEALPSRHGSGDVYARLADE